MALVYLLIVLLGWEFWVRIPVELVPDTSLPAITVTYSWGGTSPEAMERDITRKVEGLARQLKGVKKLQSVTTEGTSQVTIQFQKNVPVDYRIVEMREMLNNLSNNLPLDVSQPNITKQIPKQLQDTRDFMVWSVSGAMNRYDLLDWAQRNLKIPLSGMDGIADVQLSGVRDPALTITFNPDYIQKWHLSVNRILGQIRTGMDWNTAGYLSPAAKRIPMVQLPEYKTLNGIRQFPVQLPDSSGIVRLSSIATVAMQDYPEHSLQRFNGKPALTLIIEKTPGADALNLAARVNAKMAQLRKSLPPGVTLHLEHDSTKELRERLTNLDQQAWFSLGCVFLILLIFIWELRAPFIILSSIIFSVLMSIGLLYLVGYTLNIFTMAAITIALGMLVDNAIVVFEQVRPELPEEREQRIHHVSEGVKRVTVPVIGNTLTTVCIFIPMLFALTKLRYFLVPLGVGLTLTLLSSVVICLTWIPYALVWLIPRRNLNISFLKKIRNKLEQIRKKSRIPERMWLLGLLWRHRVRWLVYITLIFLIGIPLFLIPEPKWAQNDDAKGLEKLSMVYFNNRKEIDSWIGGISYRFYNNAYFGQPFQSGGGEVLTVDITAPMGTPLTELNKIAGNFERIAQPYKYALDYFETEVSDYNYNARIQFYFKKAYLDKAAPYMLKNDATYLAARTGNTNISVSGFGQGYYSGGGGSGSSYSYKLTGYSYDALLSVAKDIKRRLQKNPRVRNIDISGSGYFYRSGLYHYVLHPNNKLLYRYGLTKSSLYQTLYPEISQAATYGRVQFGGRQVYLMGRIARPDHAYTSLMTKPRQTGNVIYKLGEVASLKKQKVMSQITKENQRYVRYVSFSFIGPYEYGQTLAKSLLKKLPLPVGIHANIPNYNFGNTNSEYQGLAEVLLFALLIVWMIVSALLESWWEPVIILLSVPLSLVGVMYCVLQYDLSFGNGAFAGTLLLVGVVVNNAILLLHGRQLQGFGGVNGARAWIYTYRDRMRSVILTTLTTLAGLLPLMLQNTSEFWHNMAIVVFWGLSVSTVLIVLLAGIWEKKLIFSHFR